MKARMKGGPRKEITSLQVLSKKWAADATRLLPTPAESDCRNSRNATANDGKGSTGHSGTTLSDVAFLWSGASSSRPSDAGKRSTAPRLSPWFVEWMMGAPAGWTDPDCRLSATEFTSIWASSRDDASSSLSGSES
jgi:hypothetical protein